MALRVRIEVKRNNQEAVAGRRAWGFSCWSKQQIIWMNDTPLGRVLGERTRREKMSLEVVS